MIRPRTGRGERGSTRNLVIVSKYSLLDCQMLSPNLKITMMLEKELDWRFSVRSNVNWVNCLRSSLLVPMYLLRISELNKTSFSLPLGISWSSYAVWPTSLPCSVSARSCDLASFLLHHSWWYHKIRKLSECRVGNAFTSSATENRAFLPSILEIVGVPIPHPPSMTT
jgi:hypothetical protein